MKLELPVVEDPVGRALHFLRMSGTFYYRSEFTAPWALAIPAMEDSLMLHVVTAGNCLLEVEGTSSRNAAIGRPGARSPWQRPGLRSAPGVPGVPEDACFVAP